LKDILDVMLQVVSATRCDIVYFLNICPLLVRWSKTSADFISFDLVKIFCFQTNQIIYLSRIHKADYFITYFLFVARPGT